MEKDILFRPFRMKDKEETALLWERCGLVTPQNDPFKDMEIKHQLNDGLFQLAVYDGRIIGSLMAGFEGHRGWFNYLGVDPDFRHKGIAKTMVKRSLRELKKRGCPKVNLQVRESNTGVIEFYKKMGFQIDPVISMGLRFED